MCLIIRFLILVAALTAYTWSTSQAGGTYQTKPAFPDVVKAGMPAPNIALPHFSASDLVGGCGRGRVRDPQTHGCRGPADIK